MTALIITLCLFGPPLALSAILFTAEYAAQRIHDYTQQRRVNRRLDNLRKDHA